MSGVTSTRTVGSLEEPLVEAVGPAAAVGDPGALLDRTGEDALVPVALLGADHRADVDESRPLPTRSFAASSTSSRANSS